MRLSVSSGALILAILTAGPNLASQSRPAGRLTTPSQDAAHARTGFWRPSSFDRPYDPHSELSRAEFKVVNERLRAITEVLRESAALKSPVGFEVAVYRAVGISTETLDASSRRLPGSSLRVQLFRYIQTCESCPIEAQAESSSHIDIRFNNIYPVFPLWQKPYESDAEGPIYVGPFPKGDLAGFTIYQAPGRGPKLLLTNRVKRPVLVPVSQERYLRARIGRAQKGLDGYRSRGQTNDYLIRDIAALESELAGLSADERAAPAHVGGATSRPSGLSPAFDRKSQALLAPNPEFYDRTLPRTSLQVAVVETYPAELTSASFSVQKVQELLDTVDWKRIAGLLD